MFGEKYDPTTGSKILTAGQQTELIGVLLGVAFIGAALSSIIGSRYGRRAGLFLAALTSMIGSAIQAGATSWGALIAGKAVAGLTFGFVSNFVIPYWAETTPATIRGSVIAWYSLISNISQFVGQCTNEVTHSIPNAWSFRIPLLTQLIVPIIVVCFVYTIPDTPR